MNPTYAIHVLIYGGGHEIQSILRMDIKPPVNGVTVPK